MSGYKGRIVQVGKRNSTFQELEALKRNRTKRTRSGKILVEGVAPINLLTEVGWKVEAVIRRSSGSLSSWAESIIERTAPGTVYELTPQLMEEISDREDPSEIIIIAERRIRSLDAFEIPVEGVVLVADRPNSPGNLGSLIRSAYAFGCDGVIISGHGADPFDPKAIRASLGAVFGVPILEAQSNIDLSDWVDSTRAGLSPRLIGTSAKAATRVDQVDLRGPLMLVAGNETHGMSEFLNGLVDESVRIPMTGGVTSLNLACAITTVLYEVSRQREFRYPRGTRYPTTKPSPSLPSSNVVQPALPSEFSIGYWRRLDEFIATCRFQIDRPKGSRHPHYPDFIYPLDYGYLEGTSGGDGNELDVWVGTAEPREFDAILCTVDGHKRDAEVKILLGLTEVEKRIVLDVSNTAGMNAVLIRRPPGLDATDTFDT